MSFAFTNSNFFMSDSGFFAISSATPALYFDDGVNPNAGFVYTSVFGPELNFSTASGSGALSPATDNAYDLGSPFSKWANVYSYNFLSCPLPTDQNALKLVRETPDPVTNKYHHGKRKYFEIADFPKQAKFTDKDGVEDIEMTKTLGLLYQAVRQLAKEVEDLKKKKN
jgi:hypothetical protein